MMGKEVTSCLGGIQELFPFISGLQSQLQGTIVGIIYKPLIWMPLDKLFKKKKFIYICCLKFLLKQSKFSGFKSMEYVVPSTEEAEEVLRFRCF